MPLELRQVPGKVMQEDHAGHGDMKHAGEAVEYTCPMHPEVVSKEPGTCPKCGMTLVPRGAAMDHAAGHA
ncbi:MAG: hypothetical protein K8F92_00880, partial [Hyphomicrobium sp.]|nr:hypothetical protein [Hyphomicrobium sp.]